MFLIFYSSKTHSSIKDPSRYVRYTCEILDEGGDKPSKKKNQTNKQTNKQT